MYEAPIVNVDVMADVTGASNDLDRWETPIDPE